MENRIKKNNYLMMASLVVLISWIVFSISFFVVQKEASIFATEGAQPIVKILEILNYRGNELLPYIIAFFIIVSLSLVLEIFLFIYVKKFQLKRVPIIVGGVVLCFFLVINMMNELFLLLFLLVVISVLVMVSIGMTVNYLYVEHDGEDDDIISFKEPFKTKEMAEKYANQQVAKINKKINTHQQEVITSINLENDEGYYVNIYLEEIDIRGNEHEENDE